MGPPASRSSVSWGFADASDGSGGVDVATVLPRDVPAWVIVGLRPALRKPNASCALAPLSPERLCPSLADIEQRNARNLRKPRIWRRSCCIERVGVIMPSVTAQPKLLSTSQAAGLLSVSRRTVLNWIEAGKVPYVRLPGGEYRLPLSGLLSSLSGTYRLEEEVRVLDERNRDLTDEDVQAAIGE